MSKMLILMLMISTLVFVSSDGGTENETSKYKPPLDLSKRFDYDENTEYNSVDNDEAEYDEFSEEDISNTNPPDFSRKRRRKNASKGSRIPKFASCELEVTIVNLDLLMTFTSGVVFYPTCAKVPRCGGCCTNHKISCQPTEVKQVPYKVYRTIESPQFNHSLEVKGFDYVTVEEHLGCRCDCITKESDCNNKQMYNQERCSCECDDSAEAIACKEGGKFWNEKECICGCGHTEEDVCTTGSYFDVDSCSCVLEPCEPPAEGCSDKREFNGELCGCFCRNITDALLCRNKGKIWHEKDCICRCPNELECNSKQLYNEERCSCECEDRAGAIACRLGGWVWDKNECICGCGSTEEHVCTTGLYFDVDSCSCVPEPCIPPDEGCSGKHVFISKLCGCFCRNIADALLCRNKGKIWHERDCSCRCPNEIDCDSGLLFDQERCTCECEDSAGAIACRDRGKVWDEKECICGCNYTEEHVCPTGLYFDVNSCSCALQTCALPADRCSDKHEFDSKRCGCFCRNITDFVLCSNKGKIWHEEDCSCRCPNEINCNSRQLYNQEHCTCECKDSAEAIACRDVGKVWDEKECICGCDHAEEDFCTNGSYFDVDSCSCVLEPCEPPAEGCSDKHEFNSKWCGCFCRNITDFVLCRNKGMKWHEDDCSCRCPSEIDCNNKQMYNQERCSCECDDIAEAIACRDVGKVWDEKECICGCDITEEHVCTTGSYFDVDSCSCELEPCAPPVEGCSDKHEFNCELCGCFCRNITDALLCRNKGKIWHERDCSCRCPNEIDCDSGQLYDQERCTCECEDSAGAIACRDGGKVWDENECMCGCGPTEERVCTTGSFFDVESCSCVQQACESLAEACSDTEEFDSD